MDFSKATVVVDISSLDHVWESAVRVLLEEVEERTGLRWPVSDKRPRSGVCLHLLPDTENKLGYEGFRIRHARDTVPCLRIEAGSGRAMLFAVGHLLRKSRWGNGEFQLSADIEIETTPRYPLRGHQLGYRARGNTYAAWDEKHYEQYIRELALFGANAIENIPGYGGEDSPVHVMSRREMNRRISDICHQYGLEFWMWMPATFDLSDEGLRKEALQINEATYQECTRVDAVFFPGGDPGSNPPDLVISFITALAPRLQRHHPDAMIWVSLQGFSAEWVDLFHAWLAEEDPRDWFGGIVHGPGSPELEETRLRTPSHYPIRHYPDITHIVRCQYPHNQLDPMFALTLTRQGINPQPRHSQFIHNYHAPLTGGFLTYSDGAHDNVNKMVWTRLGWDPDEALWNILSDYGRFFFRPDLAEDVADALLGLEQNWEGAAVHNGGIAATLREWERIADALNNNPGDESANWRLQMMLFRATLDAYGRHRLLYEQQLEEEACTLLLEHLHDPDLAMTQALEVLDQADNEPVQPHLRQRILTLADALWHSIGLQTDIDTYQAHSAQRGAVLEYLDTPLNSRLWIQDEFERLGKEGDEDAVQKRLRQIATWERPGQGSFYDDLGNIARSSRVHYTGGPSGHPMEYRQPTPTFWSPDGGRTRFRYGWWHTMGTSVKLRYTRLDRKADYLLRVSGYGDAKPRANGHALTPTAYDTSQGGFKDFPVPPQHYSDGALEITFDELDESHLNWREWSKLAEVWLLRKE